MENAKEIALRALTGAFIDRDPAVVERYFAPNYIQHNPAIPNGREAIPALIAGLSKDFSYEPGMVVAEGDLVMVHGRYVGWGPKPMVAVDIFRVVNGKLVEHWDVMQEEVPATATVSGNPMFARVS
jgi:predicted SnoaL-like aldol condensation-catalyzing enzyme